ncbi:hypothetical protein EB796_000454 [Bugula neritina]|uniref:Kinesin motor domain-containing protein n=1 Tax=Bugula neritina TaxID=10212 RepID=A0A7J7KSY2_BUGNE|nr:hypothetical protein EB796_000454 [Bugula neritina]
MMDSKLMRKVTRNLLTAVMLISDLLENAWKGYNCTLFAYGQTGSGKSYTIMGYEPNLGLVPQVCSNLFTQINNRGKSDVSYEVTFSMLEIYNEEVRDLLSLERGKVKRSLTLRERHDRTGFFADGLTVRPVADYQAIKASLAEGDRNRSLAATRMNETSSRAHTIVTVQLRQNFPGNITKFAAINLVDLAGSERQSQTGAIGDRFKESTNINKSLTSLGNVLEALVKKQAGKKVHVNFRDSKLTMLLKNALGGNSKATMVATISPAQENYEQTLSTLRYADRTKRIKNQAHVNQAATDQLVKELLQEKERLLYELEMSRKQAAAGLSSEALTKAKLEYEEQINRYKQEMEDLQTSWAERLSREQEAKQKRIDELEAEEKQKDRVPYLWNLNEDLSLCAKIIHFLPEGKVRLVGNTKAEPAADIVLSGPGYYQQHAVIKFVDGKMSITPQQGKVCVNGKEVKEKKSLHHNDRVCFEDRAIFVINDPRKVAKFKKEGKKLESISYEFAQKELSRQFVESIEGDETLKHEVLSILPLVRDATAIAEDLSKGYKFEVVIVSPLARGLSEGRNEIYIKMMDQNTGNVYMWGTEKFVKRQGVMMDQYGRYISEGEHVLNEYSELEDPYYEPPETECLLGIAVIPLLALSMMVPYKDTLVMLNYEAERVGSLEVQITPCDAEGNEDHDYDIDEPTDLTWCKFAFFDHNQPYLCEPKSGINPVYDLNQMISIVNANHLFQDYVVNQDLSIEIWGYQDIERSTASRVNPSARSKYKSDMIESYRKENILLKNCLIEIEDILSSRPRSCESCGDERLKAVRDELDKLRTNLADKNSWAIDL